MGGDAEFDWSIALTPGNLNRSANLDLGYLRSFDQAFESSPHPLQLGLVCALTPLLDQTRCAGLGSKPRIDGVGYTLRFR